MVNVKAVEKSYKLVEVVCPILRENNYENYAKLLEFSFYIQYIFRFYHIAEAKQLAEQFNTKETYKAYFDCRKEFKFRLMAFLARHKIMWLVKIIKKLKHI